MRQVVEAEKSTQVRFFDKIFEVEYLQSNMSVMSDSVEEKAIYVEACVEEILLSLKDQQLL